jgi:predicted acylesterase/phospholipase RssA
MIKAVGVALLANEAYCASCRALVLSGGGNNGAWEAGVMWGLANYGNPADYYWDVVTGISAGAINSAGTAGFAPNEVLEMT